MEEVKDRTCMNLEFVLFLNILYVCYGYVFSCWIGVRKNIILSDNHVIRLNTFLSKKGIPTK